MRPSPSLTRAVARHAARIAAVLLVPLLALAGIPLAGIAHAACRVEPRTTVPLVAIGGNILVVVAVNDTDRTFILDTGAERTLMSDAAVLAAGIARDTWVSSTIAGVGGIQQRPNALPRSLRLGDVTLRRRTVTADASVTVGPIPITEVAGRPIVGMLGRDFLTPFDLDFDLPAGKLTLYDVAGCNGRFLPWTTPYAAIPTTSPMTNALMLAAVLDGHPVRALLDSGAGASLITAPGMYRLGLTQDSIARDPGGNGAGIGPQSVAMRLHRFHELRVGPETTRDPQIWVAPVRIVPIADMLLGADWLRTRHLWLSFATTQVFVAEQ